MSKISFKNKVSLFLLNKFGFNFFIFLKKKLLILEEMYLNIKFRNFNFLTDSLSDRCILFFTHEFIGCNNKFGKSDFNEAVIGSIKEIGDYEVKEYYVECNLNGDYVQNVAKNGGGDATYSL